MEEGEVMECGGSGGRGRENYGVSEKRLVVGGFMRGSES